MNDDKKNDTINLFWTGGWDSTFRLMELIHENRQVQPHYILRNMQAPIEIYTMIEIRGRIRELYPQYGKLLLPTIYTDSESIQPVGEISERFKTLNKEFKVNRQYFELACYARQINLKGIEICILGGINSALPDYRNENCNLFGYFNFPLLGFTKKELFIKAKKKGWMDVMEKTRFCRNKRLKIRKPCGYCGPCNDVVEAGLGSRLPFTSRVIATMQLPFRRYWRKHHNRQDSGVLGFIKKHLQTKV